MLQFATYCLLPTTHHFHFCGQSVSLCYLVVIQVEVCMAHRSDVVLGEIAGWVLRGPRLIRVSLDYLGAIELRVSEAYQITGEVRLVV